MKKNIHKLTAPIKIRNDFFTYETIAIFLIKFKNYQTF